MAPLGCYLYLSNAISPRVKCVSGVNVNRQAGRCVSHFPGGSMADNDLQGKCL